MDLDALYSSLIGGKIITNPIARAQGLLSMFNRVTVTISPPEIRRENAWTPPHDWYSRPEQLRELSASLARRRWQTDSMSVCIDRMKR